MKTLLIFLLILPSFLLATPSQTAKHDPSSFLSSNSNSPSFRFRNNNGGNDLDLEGHDNAGEFVVNEGVNEAADLVAPTLAGVEQYRDEFIRNAKENRPLGLPGFTPLGRNWPLEHKSFCMSVSVPIGAVPVTIDGGIRVSHITRTLGNVDEASLSTEKKKWSERPGIDYNVATYDVNLGVSVGIKFFKFSLALQGSIALESFTINSNAGMYSMFRSSLWPIIKSKLYSNNKMNNQFKMLSNNAQEMVDGLRRTGLGSDKAATRDEIKQGWFHQLLSTMDKEVAEVGFEVVQPLRELNVLLNELQELDETASVGALPNVFHAGNPLQIMKSSNYGFFQRATRQMQRMYAAKGFPKENRLTRAQEFMGMLRHLAVRTVYRFSEAVAESLMFGPQGPRPNTLMGNQKNNKKHPHDQGLDPLFPELGPDGNTKIYYFDADGVSEAKERKTIPKNNIKLRNFLLGAVSKKATNQDVVEAVRCKNVPLWFEGASKSGFSTAEIPKHHWKRNNPDEQNPKVFGQLLCELLSMHEDAEFADVLLDNMASNPCTADEAQLSAQKCYNAGATRRFPFYQIKTNVKNKCAWLESGHAMELRHLQSTTSEEVDILDGKPTSTESEEPMISLHDIEDDGDLSLGKVEQALDAKTKAAAEKRAKENVEHRAKHTRERFCDTVLLEVSKWKNVVCRATLTKNENEDDTTFCNQVCLAAYPYHILRRKACRNSCNQYLIENVLPLPEEGITRCCSVRKIQKNGKGSFTCAVDTKSKDGGSHHTIQANGPDKSSGTVKYKLQFPHIYRNPRTKLCSIEQLGFQQSLLYDSDPSDCYIQVPLSVANAFPEVFKAFHRFFDLMSQAQKMYGLNLKNYMRQSENMEVPDQKIGSDDSVLITSGIEPAYVRYMIQVFDALISGPSGVFGFPSIDDIEVAEKIAHQKNGKTEFSPGDAVKLKEQMGGRRLFTEWSKNLWTKRQWQNDEKTSPNPLEQQEMDEEDDAVEEAVEQSHGMGEGGETVRSLVHAANCQACNRHLCNTFTEGKNKIRTNSNIKKDALKTNVDAASKQLARYEASQVCKQCSCCVVTEKLNSCPEKTKGELDREYALRKAQYMRQPQRLTHADYKTNAEQQQTPLHLDTTTTSTEKAGKRSLRSSFIETKDGPGNTAVDDTCARLESDAGLKPAKRYCDNHNIKYYESSGEDEPDDYEQCLVAHAKHVLKQSFQSQCDSKCLNYKTTPAEKELQQQTLNSRSIFGKIKDAVLATSEFGPDGPELERCTSELMKAIKTTSNSPDVPANSILSAALHGRILLRIFTPPGHQEDQEEKCLGYLVSNSQDDEAVLALLPCSHDTVFTIGGGKVTPAPSLRTTSRTRHVFNIMAEGDNDISGIKPPPGQSDLWKEAFGTEPTRCLKLETHGFKHVNRAVLSKKCCVSSKNDCLHATGPEYLDDLEPGIGRWDLKSIIFDRDAGVLKGGMLCTGEQNKQGEDMCQLCLKIDPTAGAIIVPTKLGECTMFERKNEAEWAYEQSQMKEKTTWEKVRLENSIQRIKSAIRKTLSRVWSAKELQVGFAMIARTLETDQPLDATSTFPFVGGIQTANMLEGSMASEPGEAIDWYTRVLAEVRAKFDLVEAPTENGSVGFEKQMRLLNKRIDEKERSTERVHAWCPKICADVLHSFQILDDDGKKQNVLSNAFQEVAMVRMKSKETRTALRALEKFVSSADDATPKDATLKELAKEEEITEEEATEEGAMEEEATEAMEEEAKAEVAASDPCSDGSGTVLSEAVVSCYLEQSIRVVLSFLVGDETEKDNGNVYSRTELDNVHLLLRLLDKQQIKPPHLLPTALREKLSKEDGGFCATKEEQHKSTTETPTACHKNTDEITCEADLENECTWILQLASAKMEATFRSLLETWRVAKEMEATRKLSVARAWTFATCGASACYDGAGDEGKIMELMGVQDPVAPPPSQLSLAITEKLETGSIGSVGFTQLSQICKTRFVRGVHAETYSNVNSGVEDWGHLLPSLEIMDGKPNQLHCSMNGGIADFQSKSKSHSKLWVESILLPCLYEDCLLPAEKAGLPIRCQEAERPGLDLVCGYKSASQQVHCDCSAMRSCHGTKGRLLGQCGSLRSGVEGAIRRNPAAFAKMIGGAVAATTAGAYCLVTAPTCWALAGFQGASEIANPSNIFAGIAKTYKCSNSLNNAWGGIKALLAANKLSVFMGAPVVHLPRSMATRIYQDGVQWGGQGSATATTELIAYKGIPRYGGWRGKVAEFLVSPAAMVGDDDPLPLPPDLHHNILPGSQMILLPGECAGNPVKWVNPLPSSVSLAASALHISSQVVKFWSNFGIKKFVDLPNSVTFESGLPMFLVVESDVGYKENDPSTWKCLQPSVIDGDGVGERALVVGSCNLLKSAVWRAEKREMTTGTRKKRNLHTLSETFIRSVKAEQSKQYILHTNFATFVDETMDGSDSSRNKLGQKACLVRKKLHSAESPAAVSHCDELLSAIDVLVRDRDRNHIGEQGSLHWQLKENGMLCEGECMNCISIDDQGVPSIKHCMALMPSQKEMLDKQNTKENEGKGLSILPSTRITAKTVPLQKEDPGTGKIMVTSECDFGVVSSDEFHKELQQLDGAYINDIWPLSLRALYCNTRTKCIFDPINGQCHPKREVETIPEKVRQRTFLRSPSFKERHCHQAIQSFDDGNPTCQACLDHSNVNPLSKKSSGACMYCSRLVTSEPPLPGLCLSQTDVLMLYESKKLATTCTSLHAGDRFFNDVLQHQVPGISNALNGKADARTETDGTVKKDTVQVHQNECPANVSLPSPPSSSSGSDAFVFIQHMPAIPALRLTTFNERNTPLHIRPLMSNQESTTPSSLLDEAVHGKMNDNSDIPNITPNGNARIQPTDAAKDSLLMGDKDTAPFPKALDSLQFLLLDGIDDIKGSLNTVIQKKVAKANEAKCGTHTKAPTLRFGRCASIYHSIEMKLGIGTDPALDFCTNGGAGSATDWGFKYSKRSLGIATVTGHIDIRQTTQKGLDGVIGTEAEVLILDGISFEDRTTTEDRELESELKEEEEEKEKEEEEEEEEDKVSSFTEINQVAKAKTFELLETMSMSIQKDLSQTVAKNDNNKPVPLRPTLQRSPRVDFRPKNPLMKRVKEADDMFEFKVPGLPMKVKLIFSRGQWFHEGTLIPRGFNLFLTYDLPFLCPLYLGAIEEWIWYVGRLLFNVFQAVGSVVEGIGNWIKENLISTETFSSLFKTIGTILKNAFGGLYLIMKEVWSEISGPLEDIFSALGFVTKLIPDLDVMFKTLTMGRLTRFRMNTNMRTGFQSKLRLSDRVETSLELICTRPIDLNVGVLGTGGGRVVVEMGSAFDLGNLFNQIIYLPTALNPLNKHASTNCARNTLIDLALRVRGWVSATGIVPYMMINFRANLYDQMLPYLMNTGSNAVSSTTEAIMNHDAVTSSIDAFDATNDLVDPAVDVNAAVDFVNDPLDHIVDETIINGVDAGAAATTIDVDIDVSDAQVVDVAEGTNDWMEPPLTAALTYMNEWLESLGVDQLDSVTTWLNQYLASGDLDIPDKGIEGIHADVNFDFDGQVALDVLEANTMDSIDSVVDGAGHIGTAGEIGMEVGSAVANGGVQSGIEQLAETTGPLQEQAQHYLETMKRVPQEFAKLGPDAKQAVAGLVAHVQQSIHETTQAALGFVTYQATKGALYTGVKKGVRAGAALVTNKSDKQGAVACSVFYDDPDQDATGSERETRYWKDWVALHKHNLQFKVGLKCKQYAGKSKKQQQQSEIITKCKWTIPTFKSMIEDRMVTKDVQGLCQGQKEQDHASCQENRNEKSCGDRKECRFDGSHEGKGKAMMLVLKQHRKKKRAERYKVCLENSIKERDEHKECECEKKLKNGWKRIFGGRIQTEETQQELQKCMSDVDGYVVGEKKEKI